MTVPVEWPQFDPETNVRLVESPEPFVENIPEDLMEDLTFWNHFYDIMIPRDDSGEHFLTSRNFYLYYRNLKSNHQYSKIHPRICYKFGERGLRYIGPTLRESLPYHLRNINSNGLFRNKLKFTYFTSMIQ